MADKNAYLYHTFKAGDKGTIGGWKVDYIEQIRKTTLEYMKYQVQNLPLI